MKGGIYLNNFLTNIFDFFRKRNKKNEYDTFVNMKDPNVNFGEDSGSVGDLDDEEE